jgi:hypothetical protein
MGLWSTVKSAGSCAVNAFEQAATAVASGAADAVKTGSDMAGTALSTANQAVDSLVDGVEKEVGKVPLFGGGLSQAMHLAHEHMKDVRAAVTDATIGKLAEEGAHAPRGIAKAHNVFEAAAKELNAQRLLNEAELSTMKKVFGEDADFSQVRVKAGVVDEQGNPGRPTIDGNTINLHGNKDPGALLDGMVRLWQEKTMGPREPLGPFGSIGQMLPPWNMRMDRGDSFASLPREQQVKFLHQAFDAGALQDPSKPFIVGGKDYTAQLNEARKALESGFGSIPS